MDLIADDRIYSPMRDLLGEDFVWVGSEGMYGFSEQLRDHHWRSDGDKDLQKLAYKHIKVMLFLDPLRRESGALRVIPGSHRLPLYKALVPFQDVHANEHPTFFGQEGAEIPAYAVETDPGDMVLFNQWLFHAAYGKTGHRRTIVLKFAAGRLRTGTWPCWASGRRVFLSHTKHCSKALIRASGRWPKGGGLGARATQLAGG